MKKLVFTEDKQKRLLNVSLGLNILIVILVAIACGILFGNVNPFPQQETGIAHLKYFTVLSNILMALCALFVIVSISLKKGGVIAHVGRPTYFVSFIGTLSITLTMFVTLFFLMPFSNFVNEEFYNARVLAGGSNAILHILAPLVSIISFVCFFKTSGRILFVETLYALIPILGYGIFYLYAAYSHIGEGGLPDIHYDWYWFCQFGWMYVPAIFLGIIAISILLGWALWACNKRIYVYKIGWDYLFTVMTILLGVAGLIWFGMTGELYEQTKFFPVQVALLVLLAAIMHLVCMSLVQAKKIRDIPAGIRVFKLVSVTASAMSLLFVLFYLIPVEGWQALQTGEIFYHIFLPLFAITSFILLEHTKQIKYKYVWLTILPVGLYVIYYIGMAFGHRAEGQMWVFQEGYDWYGILTWWQATSPAIAVSTTLASYAVGWGLYLSNRAINLNPKIAVKKANI